MSRAQHKATHSIHSLDQARCNAHWDAVPELVRKIRKHAPSRTCLTLTAEAEHALFAHSVQRPGTSSAPDGHANATIAPPDLTRYVPLLTEAVEQEKVYQADEFNAQICLGLIHWQLGEPAQATARLPKSISKDYAALESVDHDSVAWSKVCALKGTHIQAITLERRGSVAEALDVYASILPITSLDVHHARSPELNTWTEMLLTGYCLISARAIRDRITLLETPSALAPFRAWSRYWQEGNRTPAGGRLPTANVPRRQVWLEYYIVLSDYLQDNLALPGTSGSYGDVLTRSEHRIELEAVQAQYARLLKEEVSFPRAEERRYEVEAFVDLVIKNWKVFCSNSWQQSDHGEGEPEAVSRRVLALLYDMTTRTFHATRLLRHLFSVHLAIAEFDLAFSAFYTYLDMVKKHKARPAKAGDDCIVMDEDTHILHTCAQALESIARYGSVESLRKAHSIAEFVESLIESKGAASSEETPDKRADEGPTTHDMPAQITSVALRALGQFYHRWAKATHEPLTRSNFQSQALERLRDAFALEASHERDPQTVLAFGTTLADQRHISEAIDVVKAGLLHSALLEDATAQAERFARQRSCISLWHLLALLLSARQDFSTASKTCEGAFDQFGDTKLLFGDAQTHQPRSDHLKAADGHSAGPRGLLDDLDATERQQLLEVKMTQLTLLEAVEGPEEAVNASGELLSLYARMFGTASITANPAPATAVSSSAPPKTSHSTIKSIKGSIFGRTGHSSRVPSKSGSTALMERSIASLRPKTSQSIQAQDKPTIQVTNENGGRTPKKHLSLRSLHHHPSKHHEKLQKRPSTAKRSVSARKASHNVTDNSTRESIVEEALPTTLVDGEAFFTPVIEKGDWMTDGQPAPGQAITTEEPTSEPLTVHIPLENNASSTQQTLRSPLLPIDGTGIKTPTHTSPSPSSNPWTLLSHVRYSPERQAQKNQVLLVRVWLLITGFYRRASHSDDARGALDEATRVVQQLDHELAHDEQIPSSSKYWEGTEKHILINELFADIDAENGALKLAMAGPLAALADFEAALERDGNHAQAIVAVSKILLDIYEGELAPPPVVPHLSAHTTRASASSTSNVMTTSTRSLNSLPSAPTPSTARTEHAQPLPLGQGPSHTSASGGSGTAGATTSSSPSATPSEAIPNTTTSSTDGAHKRTSASSCRSPDGLPARERAYALLTSLTRSGRGHADADAWFALARAHELAGMERQAREALWWCVELAEAQGVRAWSVCL